MLSDIIAKCRCSVGQVICDDLKQSGSGFFISKSGYLLTNNHVIHRIQIDDKTKAIKVEYSKKIYVKIDKDIYPARLLLDEQADQPVVYDYGVIKIDAAVGACLTMSQSSEIQLGEDVIAVGFPMDFTQPIFTKGIIASVVVRPSHINSLHKIKTILTDALFTYGSSGGSLVRASDGQVIGINTMPHLIVDILAERLQKCLQIEGIKNIMPFHDLIEYVLKYVHVGYNYAISVEYAAHEPSVKSVCKGE